MDDIVAAFAKSVNHQDCRIVNTPRLVFLCGGLTSEEPAPLKSARDFFNRRLIKNHKGISERVVLAETINDWFRGGNFGDLLELEECLADLSDTIILIVEGPGSFAELGAFAMSDVLGPKTLAIINTNHAQQPGFIKDGPVQRLLNIGSDLVLHYDWDPDNLNDPFSQQSLSAMSDKLVELLIQREQDNPKEERLQLATRGGDAHGQTMLLLADMINLFGITLKKELTFCLAEWGHKLDGSQFQRYIYLLEKLGIIEQIKFSDQKYFVSPDQPPYVRYDFVPGHTLEFRDRERIKRWFRDTLRQRDSKRADLFERYLRRKDLVTSSHV